MRQQPGLLQHRDRAGPHVRERAVVAGLVEPLPGLRPALLRAVAEGEQRLLAAQGRALPGDVEHLVDGEERRRQPAGHGRERAVVAAVAAQPGQRDEDLAGVRDHARPPRVEQPAVADPGRRGAQRLEVGAAGLQQHRGLGDVERLAVAGPRERTTHPVRRTGDLVHCPTLRAGQGAGRGARVGAAHGDDLHHRLHRRHRPGGRPRRCSSRATASSCTPAAQERGAGRARPARRRRRARDRRPRPAGRRPRRSRSRSARTGPLDVLVHNAGVWVRGDTPRLTEDGFETTFGVNVLAPHLLTALLADQLTGRLLWLGSGMAASGGPGRPRSAASATRGRRTPTARPATSRSRRPGTAGSRGWPRPPSTRAGCGPSSPAAARRARSRRAPTRVAFCCTEADLDSGPVLEGPPARARPGAAAGRGAAGRGGGRLRPAGRAAAAGVSAGSTAASRRAVAASHGGGRCRPAAERGSASGPRRPVASPRGPTRPFSTGPCGAASRRRIEQVFEWTG